MTVQKLRCLETLCDIGAARKQSRVEDLLCDNCNEVQAECLCSCMSPSVRLCSDCIISHKNRDCFAQHSFHSIAEVQHLQTSKQTEALNERKQRAMALKKRLGSASSSITAARKNIESYAEDLIKQIVIALKEGQERLAKQEAECEAILDEISKHIYEDDFKSKLQSVTSIWTGADPDIGIFELSGNTSFNTFRTEMKKVLLRNFEKEMTASEEVLSIVPVIRGVSKKQSAAQEMIPKLERYDFGINQWYPELQLSERVNFDVGSSLLMIDLSSVFLCGGNAPSVDTAYSIDCNNGRVHQEKSMNINRGWAGACLYNDEIYILGGLSGSQISQSEKFVRTSQNWQQLPSMKYRRSGFNPCVEGAAMYIAGGDVETKLEVFNFANQDFFSLPMQIPGSPYSVLLARSDSDFLLLQISKAYTFNLVSMTLLPDDRWQRKISASTIPPVRDGNCCFLLDADSDLVKINFHTLALDIIEPTG